MFVVFPLVISLLVGIATWILAVPTIGRELAPDTPHQIGFAIGLLASVSVFCLSTLRSQHTAVPTNWLLICSTICIVASLALQAYGTSLASAQAQQIIGALRERAATTTSAPNFNVSASIPHSVASAAYLSEFFGIWLGAVGVCAVMTSTSIAPARIPEMTTQREAQAIGI